MTARIRGPVVGSVLFAIYAATTGRGVGWEDSAFLQLALATLGVPHGPGFPIYILTGHVWTLPFGSFAAWGANLFSAAAMAAAGAVLLEITLELFALIRRKSTPTLSPWETAGAMGVIVAWGTLPEVWSQAVRTEVYSLTLLMVLLTAWLSLTADRLHDDHPESSHRRSLAAFWAWGMGMAIHPLVTVAAGTPWLVPQLWRRRRNARGLILAAGCALVPFSAYLYPLLRGRVDGVWAWGSFHNWAAIIDFYLRRSAWAAVPAGQNSYLENLYGWSHTLASNWPVLLWIPLAAVLYWHRRSWRYSVSMLSVVALVIWAAPFDSMNLDLWGYFLPFVALVAAGLGVFVLRAIAYVRRQMPGLSVRSRQTLGFFAMLVILGWPALAIVADNRIPDTRAGGSEFVRTVASILPESATLIAAEDNVLGVFGFAQQVEGIRPDIMLIAPGALRYPFYRKQIAARFGNAIPRRWREDDIWSARKWESEVRIWIAQHSRDATVYTQFDAIPGLRAERLQPAGPVYRITDSTSTVNWRTALDYWTADAAHAVHDPVAAEIYGRWLFNFGVLSLQRGQDQIGWKALVAAVEQAGESPEMFFLLGTALQRAGRTQEATSMFAAAFELAPYRTKYREALTRLERPLAAGP